MANYPSSVKTFTTKATNDTIEASHVNDLQDEVSALETGLLNGLQHGLVAAVDNSKDLGDSAHAWKNLYTKGTTRFNNIDYTWPAADGTLGQVLKTNGSKTFNWGDVAPTQSFRGLQLRTHPDADQAANKVMLIRAAEIVTDMGTRVVPRTLLTADITSSGAGGLDTGARVAATWYEIYYLFKGITAGSPDSPTAPAADALLLHRAPNYDSNTFFTTAPTATRVLRLATATATDLLAEGFKATSVGPIDRVDLLLLRAGAVSGRVWVEIRSDNSGSPSSTVLATSDKLDASFIATTAGGQYVAFLFRTPFTPADTVTQYHMVLNGDYTRSDAVNIAWEGVAAGGYANGVAKENNGAAWANASGVGDFDFAVRIRNNDTAVTMPSGYTEKCKIGYVFNGGGNTFQASYSKDNLYRTTFVTLLAAGSAVVPTFIDCNAVIPVGNVSMILGFLGSVAGDLWRFSGVPEGYGISVTGGQAGFVTTSVSPGEMNAMVPDVLTETQYLYYMRNAGTGTLNVYGFGFRWS